MVILDPYEHSIRNRMLIKWFI